MASRSRTLSVEFVGDTRDLERAFKRVDRSTGQAESRLSKFGAAAGTAFRVGGAAAASAAVGTGALGAKLVDLASDAEETASKFRNVFGKSTEDVTKQLDAFAKATGASKFALREQAAQFQSLVRPMGLTSKTAADMSVGMVKLATDLASFNNVSVDEAMTSIQSGLLGESEPMRRFGADLSAARVEAYAFANGMGKTAKDLTTAEKAQARYALMLQDTHLAQGDATETAGSFANQFKALKNNLSDVGTEIGMKLLPFVTKLTGALNDLFEGGGDAGKFTQKFREIGAAVKQFATSTGLQQFGRDVATIFKGLDRAVGGFGNVIKSAFGGIKQQFTGLAQVIRGFAKVIAAIFRGDFKAAFGGLKDIVRGAFNVMVGTIRTFTAPIRNAFRSVFSGLAGVVKSAFNGVVGALRSAINAVISTVNAVIRAINKLPNVNTPFGRVGIPDIGEIGQVGGGGGGGSNQRGNRNSPLVVPSPGLGKPASSGKPVAGAASTRSSGVTASASTSRGAVQRAMGNARAGARGGRRMSGREIVGLAKRAGLPNPQIMAAIALGESGGNTAAHNTKGEDSRGLWQINIGPGANTDLAGMDLFDPMVNARAAKIVLNRQGLNAWTVYSTGIYRQFLGQVGGEAIPFTGSAGGGAAGGAIGGGRTRVDPRIARGEARAQTQNQRARDRTIAGNREAASYAPGTAGGLELETAAGDDLIARGRTREGLARKRAALIARLAKVNAALKRKNLTPGTRKRLLQERAGIYDELGANASAFGELNATPEFPRVDPDAQSEAGGLLEKRISEINALERAGDISPEEARARRQAVRQNYVNSGTLTAAETLAVRGDIREESKSADQATDNLAAEIKALREEMVKQNQFADSVAAIGFKEATRFFADLISGQVGTQVGQRALTPSGGGVTVRY